MKFLSVFLLVGLVNSFSFPVMESWNDWTECSASCSGGTQYRVKTCNSGNGPYECDRVVNPCNKIHCLDVVYTGMKWSDCTATCGGGIRVRTYNNSAYTDMITCNNQPCVPLHECKNDFFIVMDSSGSIGDLNWWKQKQFVIDFLQSFRIGKDKIRVGCVTFSLRALLNFELTTYDYIEDVIDHVWRIDYMQSVTNTAEGIDTMRESIELTKRLTVPQVAIIITDGKANKRKLDTIPSATQAKDDGIMMIALGINNYNLEELTAISSGVEYVTTVDNFDSLSTVAESIVDLTCEAATALVDCSKCDWSAYLNWRPDPMNCHNYYICEKVRGAYRATLTYCPGYTYWSQELSTCIISPVPATGCNVHTLPVNHKPIPVAPITECTMETIASDPRLYKYRVDPTIFSCANNFYFDDSDGICTCIFVGSYECENEMLLHLPFDTHFDDVTCTKASGIKVGNGNVTLVTDQQRGQVAHFSNAYVEVPFLTNYFGGGFLKAFSICLYYKYTMVNGNNQILITNGDCYDPSGFELGFKADDSSHVTSYADILTASEQQARLTTTTTLAVDEWHLACWVYGGSDLKYYLDKELKDSSPASGWMFNSKSPMSIGGKCRSQLFNGYIDEVKVFKRALSLSEINNLN